MPHRRVCHCEKAPTTDTMESLVSAFRTAMLGLVAAAAMSTPALTQQSPYSANVV
jgi:hypothetical protein